MPRALSTARSHRPFSSYAAHQKLLRLPNRSLQLCTLTLISSPLLQTTLGYEYFILLPSSFLFPCTVPFIIRIFVDLFTSIYFCVFPCYYASVVHVTMSSKKRVELALMQEYSILEGICNDIPVKHDYMQQDRG